MYSKDSRRTLEQNWRIKVGVMGDTLGDLTGICDLYIAVEFTKPACVLILCITLF
jgi:hypothetical protein